MDQNSKGNRIPSPQEILRMAGENKPIDRSEIGIDTPKTSDGLQSINEGFDFLQHNNNSGTSFNEGE